MRSKRYAEADRGNCVACGTCLRDCPKGAVHIVKGCYASVDSDICVGCGKCAKVCPTGCISVIERGEQR